MSQSIEDTNNDSVSITYMPIPVPAECICLFPNQMLKTYWTMFPDGRQEIPETVPMHIWSSRMKNKLKYKSKKIPPPPPFRRNYWNNIKHTNKSQKEISKYSSNVGPDKPLPREFWDKYFELFPDGHLNPESYSYQPLVAINNNESTTVVPNDGSYYIKNSSLNLKLRDVESGNSIFIPSTGCDIMDGERWIGPG
jgi:hypothetical protein